MHSPQTGIYSVLVVIAVAKPSVNVPGGDGEHSCALLYEYAVRILNPTIGTAVTADTPVPLICKLSHFVVLSHPFRLRSRLLTLPLVSL